jgi:hypothetical protein
MKDLEEYLEIYFDIVEYITSDLNYWDGNLITSLIIKTYLEKGRGGMYLLAKNWTDNFMNNYENVTWGLDIEYIDAIEKFLTNKNKLK